jgi:thymidylate synthase (FAD)
MVTLMHFTPLPVCSHAVRTCWESFERSDNDGPKDRELIDKVGNKFKHASTLEHLAYTFFIEDISRALLQELARHRIASLSVKSTRYTLKELKDEEAFCLDLIDLCLLKDAIFKGAHQRAEKYLVYTGDPYTDAGSIIELDILRRNVISGTKNDISKFNVPDAYKTKLTWSINARSLQNFLSLRTTPSAMWEIRRLAYNVYDALPEDHKYLYTACVHRDP